MEKITDDVEREFIKLIIGGLRSGLVTVDRARESSSEFLDLLPFQSEDDVQQKLKKFTDKNNVFMPLYLFFLKYFEENKTEGLLNKMRHCMKNNQIDKAINLVKQ